MRFLIQFLPWCALEEPVTIGDVRFAPWNDEAPSDEGAGDIQPVLRKVLMPYRESRVGDDGAPPRIQRCTVIEFKGKAAIQEPGDLAIRECQEVARMLTLAGLSHRRFGGAPDSYCNATTFVYFGHWTKDDSDYFSTTLRRAAGHESVGGHRFDETVITRPEHAPQSVVSVDLELLDALVRARSELPPAQASALWDALLMFNNANTDDTWFPQELELIAMVGALERVLDAGSNAKDFAAKFERTLEPCTPVAIANCPRASGSMGGEPISSVRSAWAREIYRLRGDPAHGRIASRQPHAWDDMHHLVLARLAFPLVVKARLFDAGIYAWTDADRDRTNAFEAWACDPDPFAEPEGATWGPQFRLELAIAKARDERNWRDRRNKTVDQLANCGDGDSSLQSDSSNTGDE